jgi:hypothetical protein
MTTQLSLLDSEWCKRMMPVVIERMAGRDFTADELHGLLEQPDNPNLFGALMAKLRCSKRIQHVGFATSKRPERNGGTVRVWRLMN